MSVNAYLSQEERTVLERVRVGVAGAGGLGSNCAMHLVRAGVRKLVLADFDVVTEANLNRQFFFRDQIGEKKVSALADNLRRIEPGLELDLCEGRLDAEGCRKAFRDCDVVVEAFDSAEAKGMLYAALSDMKVVGASGLGGWGRSDAIRVRRVGANMVLVGDFESDVTEGAHPQSPRVGMAAAMEANAAIALLLGLEL